MNENEVLEKFEVEELEKRYEMAWIKSATIETPYGDVGPIEIN